MVVVVVMIIVVMVVVVIVVVMVVVEVKVQKAATFRNTVLPGILVTDLQSFNSGA